MTPFAWNGHSITVRLDEHEASLLARLPLLLAGVGLEADDAAAGRLYPAAYEEDEEADGEYRRLMTGELDRARSEDRDVFAETVRRGRYAIAVSDAEAWLRVIGDARLALAARRGILEGSDEWEQLIRIDPDLALVAWLGHLQAVLVDALADAMG
ncbi:MAG: DUF2017 family protein [Actinobacteria bacterium]|nr:MAG: DUF2017 family protein [Actinomycetota bacterium]